MNYIDACVSNSESDQIICQIFGPNWQDALISKEGRTIQLCDRCKQCTRLKPEDRSENSEIK
jgi:hypothetical protein